jgi:hypothetical protein
MGLLCRSTLAFVLGRGYRAMRDLMAVSLSVYRVRAFIPERSVQSALSKKRTYDISQLLRRLPKPVPAMFALPSGIVAGYSDPALWRAGHARARVLLVLSLIALH